MIMKRFFLFTMAALMTASVSAQIVTAKRSNMTRQTRVQTPLVKKEMKQAPSMLTIKEAPMLQRAAVPAQKNLIAKPRLNDRLNLVNEAVVSAAPRKVGELQESYMAQGHNYFDQDDPNSIDTWTMVPYMSEEGDSYLINVIPSPFEGVEAIPVEYIQDGNTIIVEPQMVLSSEEDGEYVFIFSWASDDMSIRMTLGEDGSLTTVNGESISYGSFSDSKFDVNFAPVSKGGTYQGSYADYENVSYSLPGQAPKVYYQPTGLYLNSTFDSQGQYYTAMYSMLPAFANSNFSNLTSDFANSWQWSMDQLNYNTATQGFEVANTITADTRNFVAPLKSEVYAAPKLIGGNEGNLSAPFQWGLMNYDEKAGTKNFENAYIYCGVEGGDFETMMSLANPDNSIAQHPYLATPDLNAGQFNISSLVLYQGKPDAPLYFEGVNMFVYQWQAKENCALKCKIQKVQKGADGRLAMGDVIAESDLDVSDVESNGWYDMLKWTNFYTVDEVGMTNSIDYLQVEDEFAIVIDGWNNGTFSAIPTVEYDNYAKGSTYFYFNIVQNGEESLVAFTGSLYKAYVGFINPIYGFLHTEDDTTVVLPAEGGSKTLRVNPMLYAISDETKEAVTALWTEEENDPEYVFPEWIGLETTNDTYTDNESFFDLVVSAEALPEGVDGRMETINLYQWGAKLTLTVVQGTPSGIVEVSGDTKKAANNHIYTLSGQRVNKAQKGVYIIGGKKQVVK